jgi:hypothetical protein
LRNKYNNARLKASDKEVAPQVLEHPGARPTERMKTVDTAESSVFRPREAREDHHPHACTDGLVFLTYTVFDEVVGEEVERLEVVPCRRCADNRQPRPDAQSLGL